MFFASLHSSKRKFATAQYVNRERFLSPYLHSLFVICSSALATRTFFSSSFLYLPVRLAPSFLRLFFICLCGSHRHLFVFCSFFLRLLFVHCSFIVRLLFVFCSFIVRSLFVFCSFFLRLLFVYPCGSHRLFITCPSCYDCLSCYDCPYDSHCGINSAFANYPIIYYLCPIVND